MFSLLTKVLKLKTIASRLVKYYALLPRHVFKVLANMDGHLDRAAAAAKPGFNYVLVCEEVEDETELVESIKELGVINTAEVTNINVLVTFYTSIQVVAFTTNPVQPIIVNMMVRVKGNK